MGFQGVISTEDVPGMLDAWFVLRANADQFTAEIGRALHAAQNSSAPPPPPILEEARTTFHALAPVGDHRLNERVDPRAVRSSR